jgi:hypothetical protein
MSLTALRQPLAIRSRQSLTEALFEEGYEYVAGRLEEILGSGDSLRSLNASEIEVLRSAIKWGYTTQERRDAEIASVKKALDGKSSGARYLGWQLAMDANLDVKAACSDWAALKSIRQWMATVSPEWLAKMNLAEKVRNDHFLGYKLQPGKLLRLGIRFGYEAKRFCELYQHVAVEKRPWGSCFQPNQKKVLAIALTPNYKRLPLWVKKQMTLSSAAVQPQDGRVGDIWRLIPCAKAWKWCPDLPKGLAEKIGNLSPKMRLLAAIAWENCPKWAEGETYRYLLPIERKECFYLELAKLQRMSLRQIISTREEWNSYFLVRLIEAYTGIPYGFIPKQENTISWNAALMLLAQHGDPATVCKNVFGVSGKGTIKAFSECKTQDAWEWAMHLAAGNPDLLQKYFALTECVGFQSEALQFLRELKPEVALRMISATTFKVRGEEKPVEDFLVRDTGYLWENIRTEPDLGRIRCWLSVHEELARKFVAEQPDEALPIPANWQPLQGLCSVNGEWEIELPNRTATLKLWGEQLHHCVGGYGPKVKRGDCVIFGVRVNGIVRYTVEMESSYCRQFYGERNSSPDYELKNSVLEAIAQAI